MKHKGVIHQWKTEPFVITRSLLKDDLYTTKILKKYKRKKKKFKFKEGRDFIYFGKKRILLATNIIESNFISFITKNKTKGEK